MVLAMTTRRRGILFSIPYAGGTTTAYRTLEDSLGPALRYVPLELPGRGFRQSDPACKTVDAMVDALVRSIDAELTDPAVPYFIFGHSLGARLAYLIAVKKQALGQTMPMHLFIGGEGPPEVCPWRSDATSMDRPERFRAEVIGSGSYPEELLRVQGKAEEILPVVRMDLEAFDEYTPPRPPKLTCDVTAILSTRDVVRREEMDRWGRRTEGKFDVKVVTGSHFFFLKQMPVLGKVILESIRGRL